MTRTSNSRLAGFMFLFYIATGVAGMVLFAATSKGLASIAQHATLVRAEAVYALLMMMNPFILAVALYALTRDYDRELALLALVCRIAEGMVVIANAAATRALLAAATAATGASAGDAAAANALGSALLHVRGFGALFGAALFAIGSTIYCYLFLRARSIPLWLAWLGVLASVLLVIGLPLQLAGLLAAPATSLMWIPMAVFEVTFGLWLLIKGV